MEEQLIAFTPFPNQNISRFNIGVIITLTSTRHHDRIGPHDSGFISIQISFFQKSGDF